VSNLLSPKKYVVFTIWLATSSAFGGDILFQTDFEDGTLPIDTPKPTWYLKPFASEVFGPGNMFAITTTTSHSGKYSLRFDYEGRNGICNECGVKRLEQKNSYNSVPYFVDSAGRNLKLDPFYATTNVVIYNKSNGFSKWEIDSVDSLDATNDRLSVTQISDGIGGEAGIFRSGDTINIARQCGINGYVGNRINRRSDCNAAILYFGNVSQNPGQSIFRRVYLRADVQSPPSHQKLQYWKPPSGKPIILFGTARLPGVIALLVTGLADKGGKNVYLPDIVFEPGIWYYVEQEFRAESAPGKGDGAYRLWVAKSGEETSKPIVEVTNITLPPVKNTSLWGNHQHFTDSFGYWYIDDFAISDTRLGPTSATGVNIAPPMSPTNLK